MPNSGLGYFVEERQEHIREYIERVKRVSVDELIQYCKVSPSTIRNDLAALEKKGLIHRTHGGAMSVNRARVGAASFTSNRMFDNADKKDCIAARANSLIEDGDTIALLAGTTTLALAKTLVNKSRLTIVVNDIEIARWLDENTSHSLYVLGGFVRRRFHFMTFDPMVVEGINVDKAFFSCTAFSVDRGAMVSDFNLANCQRRLLQKADSVVMLCDSTKFGEVAFARILGTDDLDMIVTDGGLSQSARERLEAVENLQLVVAP